ncbi:hypothetical protein KY290_012003 [Solanum tuberosum]|uniref:Leucine-rich repeat-containing N-terminal plant-type domain-containing protein n=1 Tax=Solanum tuberosum TaxID=4113 RepID=A0ABQ7W294_SOLTU|nr:hypothetical protein KY289_011256 [Solanum tuberosum]KAH0706184.1 hypothetical protein KY289_011260 [Solanum tuberosum]KAH0706199.1 hypothetical protein KY289_011275 [Solanum tuberosum]KAH0708096.1 hypothetical protein KY284_009523 [Solanum tuberosum]KAH0736140.1 hypothetical protein KY285_011847 [Solanum tuberosum]
MFTINPNASNFCREIITDQEIQSYRKTLLWNKSTDCCSWDGVHCDEMTGQVIELDLSYSTLQGKFHSNSSLFQLSNLKRLDLSCNNFTGSLISPKFGEFSSLTHLDLSVRFPTTKWNSTASLMYLRLYDVNITDRIPESFSHLTSLLVLDMSDCNLSGSITKPLWNLTNIEFLDLGNNHLKGPISLFSRFGKLKELSLRNNNFDGQLEFNRSWTQLESLQIPSNYLTGSIPSNGSGLQNLKWLDYGKIQEFKSKTLDFVSLKQNKLEGPIPNSLLNQPILTYLLLSHNNISGQIASAICNLKALILLELRSNNLEGTIPHCLGEMNEYLWNLDLSNNSLSGTININFSIGNSFRVISLHGNKLTGKVPPSLINCKYLTLLDLGNNQLNDTFPNWLGNLPDLQILSLRSNKFHGPIKSSGNTDLFARLQILDLSSNGFSGNLPISLFGNLQSMKKIDESTTTPEYVSDEFAGYYDYLTTITTKGQDYNSVRILDSNMIINLSKNRFEGHIPNIIGDLVGLRTLNLSHNVLEGHIPASLQNLSVLESLDISSNKISGGIPPQLASLTFLAVLNLSHNHLVGCIPKGKQFDTFEDTSYQGNDGLRGLPLSKHCGRDDRVPQAITPSELDQEEEEEDSPMISWQAVLMGYGCGLVIGLSVIYIMLSTHYPTWFLRIHVYKVSDYRNNTVAQATIPVELDQEEEEDSPMISWQAVFMGYGCGLVIGQCNIHNVVNSVSNMVFEDGCKIGTKNCYENERHKKRYWCLATSTYST